MKIIYLIIFFILGSFLGSLFTTIGLRLPRNEKLTKKYHCDSCGHELKFIETIPYISYLIQKGKCNYCHNKIDLLTIYIEFFSGILFAVAYHSFGLSYELMIGLGVISILMIVLVSDLMYLIIPDEVLIFFSIYFLIFQFLNLGIEGGLTKLASGIFLFALMYVIMLIGNKAMKKETLGGGDIKMMFVFGIILDPLLGTLSIFIGSLIALPISLFLLYKNKEKVIPFGPFLLVALAIIYFTKLTPEVIVNFLTFK